MVDAAAVALAALGLGGEDARRRGARPAELRGAELDLLAGAGQQIELSAAQLRGPRASTAGILAAEAEGCQSNGSSVDHCGTFTGTRIRRPL